VSAAIEDCGRAPSDALAGEAAAGCDEAFGELAKRMYGRLCSLASRYFNWGWGLDRDDLYQVGLIGVFESTKDYDPTHEVPFEQFAYFAAMRSMVTAIRGATSRKNEPLSRSARLDAPTRDGLQGAMHHVLTGRLPDPAWLVETQELLALIVALASDVLSDTERECLALSLSGVPVSEAAKAIGRDPKCVDNALRRGRKKLSEGLELAGWTRDRELATDGLAPSGLRRRLIDQKRRAVLAALEDQASFTKQEIAEQIGAPVQGLHKLLGRMQRQGEVVQVEGLWQKPAPIDPSGKGITRNNAGGGPRVKGKPSSPRRRPAPSGRRADLRRPVRGVEGGLLVA
jgi:RNA polymerase sigma factor (sigma-70 family)